jgi:hypothetical protein
MTKHQRLVVAGFLSPYFLQLYSEDFLQPVLFEVRFHLEIKSHTTRLKTNLKCKNYFSCNITNFEQVRVTIIKDFYLSHIV